MFVCQVQRSVVISWHHKSVFSFIPPILNFSEQTSDEEEKKREKKSKQRKSDSESESEEEDSESESSQSESEESESEAEVKKKKKVLMNGLNLYSNPPHMNQTGPPLATVESPHVLTASS